MMDVSFSMGYKGKLSYKEVKKTLLAIPDQRKQQLLTIIYASGSRVGEITRHKDDIQGIPENLMKNHPLKPSQIYWNEIKNNSFLELRIWVEKSIQYSKKGIRKGEKRFRVFDIPPKKEPEFCDIIWSAKEQSESVNQKYIFDISSRTAQTWFREFFPEFDFGIHHLRHWRITHLLSGEAWGIRVPKDKVQKMVGHSTLSTTHIYDHTEVEDWIGDYA